MTLVPVLLATALAAAPRVAVVVHTTGFSDDDARRVRDKAQAEVKALGAEVWALSAALEVRPECVEDRACARELVKTAECAFLLRLDVLRAGGQASFSAVLIDADGAAAAEAQGVLKVDGVLGEAPLFTAEVLAPLRATTPPPPPSDPPPPKDPPPVGEAPLVSDRVTPPEQEPEAPQELSAMAIGGVATLGVGAVLAVAGGAAVAGQVAVLNNPTSSGDEKEQAALVLVPAMSAVAGLGVAVVGAGGVLLWLGLDER